MLINLVDCLSRIFAVDGEKWLIQRKATAKIFNGNNFRGIIGSSIDHDIKKLQIILARHAETQEGKLTSSELSGDQTDLAPPTVFDLSVRNPCLISQKLFRADHSRSSSCRRSSSPSPSTPSLAWHSG